MKNTELRSNSINVKPILTACAFSLLLSLTPTSWAADASPTWQLKLEQAEKSHEQANPSMTESLLSEALAAASKGAESSDAAKSLVLNYSGVMHLRDGRLTDAQKDFSQAYEIRKKTVGAENELTLQSLSNYALSTYKTGDEKLAEELYKTCIETKRKISPGSPTLATTLTNLANLYSDERRCKDAKELYLEALEIDRKHFGENHVEVANDLFNTAALLHRCNEFAEAQGYLERAITAFSAIDNKYGAAKSLHYMALCHTALNQHDKAAEASIKALHLHELTKQKGHQDTLVHILNAADSIDASGKQDEAEKLYKEALGHAEAGKPSSNFQLAQCNLEMAQFYKRHHKGDEAEHYFKKALVHYDHLNKKEKRSLYEVPLAYSHMLAELKRTEESDKLARKYLHVYAPTAGRQ